MLVFLGNPGTKYDGTRHNVGWSVGDVIAERCGEPLATVKSRRQRLVEQLRRRAEALGKIQDNTNIQTS